jgi:hypothetical protein
MGIAQCEDDMKQFRPLMLAAFVATCAGRAFSAGVLRALTTEG